MVPGQKGLQNPNSLAYAYIGFGDARYEVCQMSQESML